LTRDTNKGRRPRPYGGEEGPGAWKKSQQKKHQTGKTWWRRGSEKGSFQKGKNGTPPPRLSVKRFGRGRGDGKTGANVKGSPQPKTGGTNLKGGKQGTMEKKGEVKE